jgi:lipoprotein-anchoring transpeptidase ErfK/SrfK
MKLNGLALVSVAVLLSMSGAANAQAVLTELARFGLKAERPLVSELRTGTAIKLRTESRVSRLGDDPLAKPLANFSLRYDAGKKVSSIYDDATSQILDNVNANVGQLSQQQLESIINASVIKAIGSAAKEPNRVLTFEVATGKLTVNWSYTGTWGKVTVGEINVYKVSATAAAGVFACMELVEPEHTSCVKAALAEAKTRVTEEMNGGGLKLLQDAHPVHTDSSGPSASPSTRADGR